MTIHIIGLGQTGKQWNGQGISIGVNDAEKWGHKVDYLAVFNHPSKFSKEPDRMKIITKSKPKEFFTHAAGWKQWFPNARMIRPMPFVRRIKKGINYSSKTSPMIAMSIAWNMGAREIVLWGVDFVDHKLISPHKKEYNREIETYIRFIHCLIKEGVQVYCGAEGSVFCNHLPICKNNVL